MNMYLCTLHFSCWQSFIFPAVITLVTDCHFHSNEIYFPVLTAVSD